MPRVDQIPWEEFVQTHNRIHGTNFKTPREMVKVLYEQKGTLLKVSEHLGISDNSVSLFMMKHGLPRLPKGHRGNSAFQVAYRAIKDPGQYKHRELAEMLGCSTGYVSNLVKRHTK